MPRIRVDQYVVEVGVIIPPNNRVSQAIAEVIVSPTAVHGDIAQVPVEVICTTPANNRVSQMAIEVLIPMPPC